MRSIAQINEQVAGKTGLEDGEMAGWRDEKVFPLFFFFSFLHKSVCSCRCEQDTQRVWYIYVYGIR